MTRNSNVSISFSKSEQNVSLFTAPNADTEPDESTGLEEGANSSKAVSQEETGSNLLITPQHEGSDCEEVSSAMEAMEQVETPIKETSQVTQQSGWSFSIGTTLAVLVSAWLCSHFSKDFLLGALVAILAAPVAVFFVIRYYVLEGTPQDDVPETEESPPSKSKLEELSGWVHLKEASGEKKPVYVRLIGRQMKMSFKDSTSRIVDLKEGTKLQLVSPYSKTKKRLKHLWFKHLPIVLRLDEEERLVIYFRDCKQKETWFWALYPLFHSIEQRAVKLPNNEAERDWFNLFLGRAFRDLLTHPKWRRWVRRKCQQKLRKLPLPQFVDRLRVRRVALGTSFPKLTKPTGNLDSDGQAQFSFQLEATSNEHESVFEMTLETRLNASYFTSFRENGEPPTDPDLGMLSDDDDDEEEVSLDTVSSSSDEEDESQFEPLPYDESRDSLADLTEDKLDESQISVSGAATDSSGKPRGLFDKLREKGSVLLNKNKTVRKYFDELVSSSQLTVTVRVISLKGTLLLSQPTWPSDRIWFKMAPRPDLKLHVHLQHGNAGRPLIRSTWLRNLLEERLRRHLVTVLCTFDDVTLHPLLVLPSPLFYSTHSTDEQEKLFLEKL